MEYMKNEKFRNHFIFRINREHSIKKRLKKRRRGALLNFQPLSMEKSYAATSRFRKTVKARA